jgi:hypothetical protein
VVYAVGLRSPSVREQKMNGRTSDPRPTRGDRLRQLTRS